MLQAVSIALNEQAVNLENRLVSDDSFWSLAIGIALGAAVCALGIRAAVRGTDGGSSTRAAFAAAMSFVAIIGAVVTLVQPTVFNAGYGCLGLGNEPWLAVAMRPTPAPCGYLIPASDASLFYPAAFAAFAAAALGIVSAILNLAGRSPARA